MARSLEYMGLTPGTPLDDVQVDRVFIGSCTNGRIEDLRAAAEIARGRKVAADRVGHGRAGLRPGEGPGREAEGLDRIFLEAGLRMARAGCSMCLGMNPDKLEARRALCFDLATAISRAARAGAGAPI